MASNTNSPYGIYTDQNPAYTLTMSNGAIMCENCNYNLNEGGYVNVVATDVFAIKNDTLYFLIEEWPASYRSGTFTFTKTSSDVSNAQIQSCDSYSVIPAPIAASIVIN